MNLHEFKKEYRFQKSITNRQRNASAQSAARAKRIRNVKADQAKALKERGLTNDEIAKQMGLHVTTVRSYLRK